MEIYQQEGAKSLSAPNFIDVDTCLLMISVSNQRIILSYSVTDNSVVWPIRTSNIGHRICKDHIA